MKNYISILMLICFASFSQAQNNFDNQWKMVIQLENEGLTKSAAELVDTIYNDAKASKNKQQQIKALLHKSKYMLILEEEAQLNIVNLFKSEIEAAKDIPTKRLLENMLATLYWQYFQQNRYKFYDRTKTDSKVSNDFRTWDLETLFNEIHVYYQRSLENGLLLQQEGLENYSTLLNEAKDSKIYRPTLYDLLSHNALQFYKTTENSIAQPSYQFKIENEIFIADSEQFINAKITSKDSLSLQLHALKIYQNLTKFHRSNTVSKAFFAIDIERLNYVAQHATFNNKKEVLLHSLKEKAKQLQGSPLSALYNFEIAKTYRDLGSQYNYSNDSEAYRWKLKEALELCDAAISDYPESDGAKKCSILKQQILQPSLRLEAEEFLPINAASRILVTYKNLTELGFSIYKIDSNQLETFKKAINTDDKLKFFNKLKPLHSFTSNLKSEGDYQEHSTEVIIPQLTNGFYLIKADTKKDSVFAVTHLQVTDLALLESTENDVVNYQLINRTNGLPIVDAVINITYRNNRDKLFSKMLSTDRYGKFSFKKDGNYYREVEIRADYKEDIAFFGDYYISRSFQERENNDTQYNVFLFTDRSIYRPGQTAYFKGITTATKANKTEVYANEKATVTLRNVNGEIVKELELKTNEYGSVAGEFILPNDGLTGSFTIEMVCGRKGYTYFSVEEYKRPKFKPEFQPITETFKVNDSITVKGKAIAFAGSNITDAKVVYRVKRQVQYPSWWYWRRPGYYSSEAQEITFGESTTNDKGEFEITFTALPDESVSKDNLPIFNYEVTADVTDINGETRSTSTVVNVGYHAMTLQVSAPNQIDKTKKEAELILNSQNLNGEFVPAQGTLKIYKLKAPTNVLRNRPWNAPDFQVISKEEFKRLFPHDPYNDEHLSTHWDKGEEVFSTDFDTEKEKTITLKKLKKWNSGRYIIIAESKDKFGKDVKAEAFTNLFSDNDKTVADNQLFEATLDKDNYKAGDVAKLTIGSAAKDITVTVEVEKDNNIIVTQLVTLNNSKQTISIPVLEDDLGGFEVHTSFAAFNSYVSQSFSVNVPYPKTDLEIETTTFRDKLQPGQDETWSFKIKGPKGDKVSAELLASMYDASLDEFRGHHWNFNPINRPSYYSRINKNGGRSFGTTSFRLFNRFAYPRNYDYRIYDQLNWYGFSFDGSHYYARRQFLRRQYENTPSHYNSRTQSGIKKGFIEGNIIDKEDGLPLPGVSIIIKGTSRGAQTDFDGNFKLEAKKGDIITISYIGMKTLDIKIGDDNIYNINLVPDYSSLDEVVVVGYGTTTKRALAGTQKLNDSVYFESRGNFTTSEEMDDSEYNILMERAKVVPDKKIVTGTSQMYINDIPKNEILIRKNLNETAFFFPQLQTDEDGNVSFNFKAPEALTKWKLQLLSHTKTLESSVKQLETVTQKDLMVIPNAPRFLREGDQITISTKIANLTEKELSGIARLELTNPVTGEFLSQIFLGEIGRNYTLTSDLTDKDFTVDAKGNTQVSWKLNIPKGLQAVQYKIIAISVDPENGDQFSDGEQNALPVLSNRMLVTETLPMWIRSNETKTFTLEKLKDNTSTTLTNHKLTLEMTSNPAWYAVQALPYLMEYPYDCNEQTFSRYYANALAQHIVSSNPKIEAVFNQWATSTSLSNQKNALLSNLEKNQELKSLLIQETPWLRDAQSETEQKKRIGLLFDLNKMNNELNSALRKLKQNQLPSGAWPWFNGGYANRFITQHIISGFGHLKQLNVIQSDSETSMISNAIQYLDTEFVKEYKDIRKYNKDADLSKDHLSYTQLHYMYVRSFYPEVKASKEVETIMDYYKSQMQTYWLKRSLYAKGLMTLTLHRMNDDATSGKILKSLKENSITSDELGMYWKANTSSWYWHQAPIETQSLLVEAFSEVGTVIQSETKNLEDIDNLKIWLLKNKQTNKWETTKATTEAVYALLLQGSSWLEASTERSRSVTEIVDVKVGNETINPSILDNVKVEAGTGYYKTSWTGKEITPDQANVSISKKGDGIAWGALYWQYFEDLDKITSAETPLKLSKKLFLKTNTDKGEEISEITKETKLIVGDLVRVRIELRSDRDMEFVHLKDMRAAGFEPINVLSQYKWQDGLGYYESTKDAATNFFMDYLPKGVYVFEYDLRVNNAGDMSNGISTIQSMYAPEFSSHSEGVRVNVE
ncbi:MAG: carboxypeptidase-like regulatory domain-containing protein [Winogradskyella sp.]|nr:carboxypeptidase-like regulatory domain-containing protein [Winogradskyella sp.]